MIGSMVLHPFNGISLKSTINHLKVPMNHSGILFVGLITDVNPAEI
jgi:hypothetical protein